jgi:hypothetical protein
VKKTGKILIASILALFMATSPACSAATKYDGNYKSASPEEIGVALGGIDETTVFGDLTQEDYKKAFDLNLALSLNASIKESGVEIASKIDFKTNGKIVVSPVAKTDTTDDESSENDDVDFDIKAATKLSFKTNSSVKAQGQTVSSSTSKVDDIAWIGDYLYITTVNTIDGESTEPEYMKINPILGLFYGLGKMSDAVKDLPVNDLLESLPDLGGLDLGMSDDLDVEGAASAINDYGFDLGLDTSDGIKLRIKSNANLQTSLNEQLSNTDSSDDADETDAADSDSANSTEDENVSTAPEYSIKVNDITAYAIFDENGTLGGVKFNVSIDFVVENTGKVQLRANGSLEPSANATLSLPNEEELAKYVQSNYSLFGNN